MYKETMGFVKGLGTGMLAAAAVTVVGCRMMKRDKKVRRDVNRALDAVGTAANSVAGSVEHMFR